MILPQTEQLTNTDVSARYEHLYTMLLDAIPSSVLLIAKNLRIISANRNFLEKSQRSLRETVGHRLEEAFPSVILEQMDIARRVQHVIETNQPTQGERITYRAPGVPIRIYYYSLTPFSWQGQTEGVLLLMDDVTEQVRLSEEVRRVERHMASIVDSASDLMLSTDKMGNILTWNSAAERLSGYSAAEVLGHKFVEYCAGEEQADIEDIFARIDTRNATQIKECPLKTKRSTFILVSWVFSPLPDRSSQTVGVVAVGRDLTERRKFEMELIQSQRLAAMGVMAGGIAHEIRNPLAICSSAAQFLTEEDDITPEFRKECAEKICRGIQRATAIIESLLKFSHPCVTARTSSIDLVDMIQETLNLLAQQATLQRIETKVIFPKGSVVVQGEATLLQQVFMNLFLNAINAMPRGGRLEVGVRPVDAGVCVMVSDTGCGIAERDIERIFDPFYTTSPVGKGTGLGLSICYSIVQQHGGSIFVESTEGKGSTFIVTLPLHMPAAMQKGEP
ncbi:MAG TPA: ATP-binding protein [Rectinemataceae bacterium]|nr:ATP-binding protein [Rectinemataceae bacterium]